MKVGPVKSEFLFYSTFRVEWDSLVTMARFGSVSRAAIVVVAEGSIAGVGVSSGLASFVFMQRDRNGLNLGTDVLMDSNIIPSCRLADQGVDKTLRVKRR